MYDQIPTRYVPCGYLIKMAPTSFIAGGCSFYYNYIYFGCYLFL